MKTAIDATMNEAATQDLPHRPMGGTELMIARVRRAYPRLTEQVQLVGSRPRDVVHDPDKPKIVWLQDLIDDPSLKCLVDPTYRSVFNAIVCVSAWQQDQFARAGIPYSQTTVIKNACEPLVPTWPKPLVDGKLRLIYHSTPHRGLAVLSAAAAELAKIRQDWHLDVYSSTKIYGWPAAQDAQFEPLYQQLRDNPCVTYHGTVDQATVRQAVLEAHLWVYPSIYPETSCLCAIEALMAGCLGLTSAFGALPETCAEWAWFLPYTEDLPTLAGSTQAAMTQALDHYQNDVVQQLLRMQSVYYQTFWTFEQRLPQWKHLLERCVAEGPKAPRFVIP